jgi:hypothetical protein
MQLALFKMAAGCNVDPRAASEAWQPRQQTGSNVQLSELCVVSSSEDPSDEKISCNVRLTVALTKRLARCPVTRGLETVGQDADPVMGVRE